MPMDLKDSWMEQRTAVDFIEFAWSQHPEKSGYLKIYMGGLLDSFRYMGQLDTHQYEYYQKLYVKN